jgi:hypothetical protein
MSSSEKKDPRLAGSILLDVVVTAIAFVIFFFAVRSHVPSNDPKMILLWGAITASCLTAVFFLAWRMFLVTLKGQREDNAAKK